MSKPRPLSDWRKTTERRPLAGPKGLLREPMYQRMGDVIREMRERLQISQETVGKAVGWTRAHVANVENGRSRVYLHDLPAIARVLRIPIADLLPPEYSSR